MNIFFETLKYKKINKKNEIKRGPKKTKKQWKEKQTGTQNKVVHPGNG
jgi:hypothetical protein